MLSAAASFSVVRGNVGFLFVAFCMIAIETCLIIVTFVGITRYKGETRFSAKKSANKKETVLKE